ncbi:putative pentatricopeptide repeat-containing protein At1g53330, partial [Quercus lobata]|uniref:putative pentatricopeptide repeat-containing protein At1g53330 n=1 Tax=Quercus lobata TaxID=97700 RepID=UPI0012453447
IKNRRVCNRFSPTEIIFCNVISFYARARLLHRLLHLRVVNFGTLIHQLCLNFRLEEAFKLKNDMMRVYGVMPNAFVYTSLIKGVCGIGELSLAFKLKEEMVRNKLKLNSTVYSTLIRVLFEVGRKEEALGLLEEMKGFGCMPEATFRILDEMVEKGFDSHCIFNGLGRTTEDGIHDRLLFTSMRE